MKHNETCPKCRSMKIFVVRDVHHRQLDQYDQEIVMPTTVTAAQVMIDGSQSLVEAGRFEAWVCARCGYTEFYASRLDELAVLAESSSAVKLLDRDPAGGPYRA